MWTGTENNKSLKKKRMMSMLREFREFAIKGNLVDMATGVIIGSAFSKIVTSLVNDIIMPLISLITGEIDFSNMFISFDGIQYKTLDNAKNAGAITLNYGLFITNIIDFVIIAFSIFIVIKQIRRFQKPKTAAEPTTKTCPYCQSSIHIKAVKCPYCTSDLKQGNIGE